MGLSVTRRAAAAAAAIALLLVQLGLPGCSRQSVLPLLPNQRPTLEVTQAPVSSTQPFFYAYELRWAGYDTDGHIDHFRYAIDPPGTLGSDTVWVRTFENRKSFLFHSDQVDGGTDRTAEGYHTIVIEAVDDRGGVSAPVSRSFTSFTIAPTVQVVQPVPNNLLPPILGPSFRVVWKGVDPDGRGSNRPVKYKFHVFSEASVEFPFLTILTNPDSLRRQLAPNFATWDSVGGDTTSFDVTNLVPNRKYVAVIVAFDEVGAYSPVMSFNENMLYFFVSYAGLVGPKLTVFSESFFFSNTTGGFSLDPSGFIRTEAAAGRPVHFGWFAKTESGSFVTGYRWMLDGNVDDSRPRSDEEADFNRWSRFSPLTLGVDLPPFNPAGNSETHFLYIEAKDNNEQLSLAVVEFTVVRALFDRELLIVDDTRLVGDKPAAGGCMERPSGVWPTAAELDTFFFARGGKPWKCYPAGTLSPVGIFQGYAYDTLGTRFLPQGQLTLQQLSHYRHVIWYTDSKAPVNSNDPTNTRDPMSQLRWLSSPGRTNSLGTWVSQGGELWMFGGGVASSLQVNWEKAGSSGDVYSNADGELVPGRFMYDVMGWRSEIAQRGYPQATKPDHPIHRGADSLDCGSLSPYLFEKYPETDDASVYAPNRLGGTSNFYQSSQVGEGITRPNEVVVDLNPDPDVVERASIVDTLYESVGGVMGAGRPVMTLMHDPSKGSRQVFSGFQLWYWRRADQIALVDWVLQKAWGLPRANVPR